MSIPEAELPVRPVPSDATEAGDHDEAIVSATTYAVCLTGVSITISALTILGWSKMGWGQVFLDMTQEFNWLFYPFAGAWMSMLAVLLALDFFRPLHMPNTYMRLYEGDRHIGRVIFTIAMICMWFCCVTMAIEYPSVPLVITIVLEPFIMQGFRLFMLKSKAKMDKVRLSQQSQPRPSGASTGEVDASTSSVNFNDKMRKFHALTAREAEAGRFYCGAMVAFVIAALGSLACWLPWVVIGGNQLHELDAKECSNGLYAPIECAAQFTYRGESYAHCTMANSNVPWCSHAETFSNTWSNCMACEDSTIVSYAPRNLSDNCAWGGRVLSPYIGSIDTTLEECHEFCGHEPKCKFSLYYKGPGVCANGACASGETPIYRCQVAVSCDAGGPSAAADGQEFEVYEKTTARGQALSAKNKDELYILWSAPLVVVVSNTVFALFAAARVFFHHSYTLTSESFTMDIRDENDSQPVPRGLEDKRARIRGQQTVAMRQLAVFIKLVVCSFLFMITIFWITGQLLYADSQVATMILGLMGSFLLVFILFTIMSLRRVVNYVWGSVGQLPVWQTVQAILRSEWTRAFILCCSLPVIPIVFVLSALNQKVRLYRKIYERSPKEVRDSRKFSHVAATMSALPEGAGADDSVVDPCDMRVTPKAYHLWMELRLCSTLGLFGKCYVLCVLMVLYTLFPMGLNVFLSWFNKVLLEAGLSFELIIVITFFTGVVSFLLPPVPGLTVYIFGGLMMSSTCPDGFWAGAMINIAIGYLLKLVSCAVQQKIIGGILGKSLWVRQTCGVHKVAIRCIEAEMRRPGWTVGKVAILCGGPDWPVSVLAGILNLSLLQCELGTLPIIFFIIPCSLSGSFYMMRGTSEVWTRSGNLMLVTSVMISGILWVIAAWAIQNQLENNYKELTKPLPENVDLEWLDFKANEIKRSLKITWPNIPRSIQLLYAGCCLVQILMCQGMYWGHAYLFNPFEVSDDISTLESFHGEKGLVSTLGILVVGGYFVCMLGPVVLRIWSKVTTRQSRAELLTKLDRMEAKWKEDWVEMARTWEFVDPRVKNSCQPEEDQRVMFSVASIDPPPDPPSATAA